MTKTHDEIIQKWIEFWNNRGSLFIQNANTIISAEQLLRNKKLNNEMKLNLFFSINWYKIWAKNRKAENITKYNAFFFDIDLWITKHNNVTQKEALDLIKPYFEQFDFIVQTAHGFHLYILLPEWKYTIDNNIQYLTDWKEKWADLENVIGLSFDKACYLSTQIARVVSSIHQKIPTQNPTKIKLLKWIELLFPLYEKQKMIDNISITNVLEALDIKYQNDRIFENWRLTNGRKVNLEWNYINDFANKGRPVWWPFSFVKHRFIKNNKFDSQKIDIEATIKAYWFFTEKFWITQSLKKHKTIAMPQILEATLIMCNLNWKDIQIILALIYYARQYFQTQLPYGNKITTNISDIIKTVWLSENITNIVLNLKSLKEKLNNLNIAIKWVALPILSFELEKKNNERFIKYLILPLWYQTKQYRRLFYWTHYINSKSLEIQTKGNNLKFYIKLCSELLSIWRLAEWEISKMELAKLFDDKNFTRIKQKIEKIIKITQDFSFTTTWKFVQFQKI